MKKIKEFIRENTLFFLSMVITVLFLIGPMLLRISIVEHCVSLFVQPLNSIEYKSSYIETAGAILGTFLAVTGALWTQRRIDTRIEKNIIKECAVRVYYDFKFAFDDIFEFEHAYACINPETRNQYDDLECFIRYKKGIKIYIDSEWISNVAKLCGVLTNEEIRQVYQIYGDLETIKQAFDMNDNEIDEKLAHRIYNLIYRDLCVLILAPRIEVYHKEINENLMKRLEHLIQG